MTVHRQSSSLFRSVLLLSGLLLGAALLAFPLEATAQDDGQPTLVKHLRSELKAKDAERRHMALVDINTLAHCGESCTVNLQTVQGKRVQFESDAGKGSVVDLDGLVPDLLESYRRGPADGHRLLALSALLHIGNERALERLIEEETPQSKGVKRATQRGLASFYLTKYPELMKRAVRTRQLSLDDVAEAKAYRMRKAKSEK